MLLYGTVEVAKSLLENDNIHFYNFTSLSEMFNRNNLNLIPPPHTLVANTEYEFDVQYMHWILDNDINFVNFMKIIMDLYNGIDAFLVIANGNYDNWSDVLVESLLKLIQQRYGIVAARINEYNDIYYAEDSNFVEGYGVMNLDMDKERYTYIVESFNVNQNKT